MKSSSETAKSPQKGSSRSPLGERMPRLRFPGFKGKWKLHNLSKIGEFYSGLGFGVKYQGHKGLPIHVYKVSDMNLSGNEKFMVEANNSIDLQILKAMGSSKFVSKPSIIFAKVGAAVYGEKKRITCQAFITDNNMMAFTPNDEFDIEYIWNWFLRTSLSRSVQTSALPSLNTTTLGTIEASVPDHREQGKISGFLSLVDARIAAQRKLVELLKKHKRGLLQNLFPSDDGKMNLRFKGCEQGWRWETVSSIFQTINDKAFQIKTSEYHKEGRFDVVDQGKKDVVGYSDDEVRVFKTLPIIVFGDHTTIVKYRDRPFIVGGDGVKLLNCQRKDCDLQYLFYALLRYGPKAEGYKRHFGILKEKKIPILPLKEQLGITGILSLQSSRVSSAKCALMYLESLKRGLLQQLFA